MPQTSYIGARIPDSLRARVDRAKSQSVKTDGKILRAALEQFLAKHKTPKKVIGAVIQSVRRGK